MRRLQCPMVRENYITSSCTATDIFPYIRFRNSKFRFMLVFNAHRVHWEYLYVRNDSWDLTLSHQWLRFPWMTPCRLVYMHRRFVDNRCFHLQGIRTPLKVEAAGSYETVTFVYQTTKISHSRKNLQEAFVLAFCMSPFPTTWWKHLFILHCTAILF